MQQDLYTQKQDLCKPGLSQTLCMCVCVWGCHRLHSATHIRLNTSELGTACPICDKSLVLYGVEVDARVSITVRVRQVVVEVW